MNLFSRIAELLDLDTVTGPRLSDLVRAVDEQLLAARRYAAAAIAVERLLAQELRRGRLQGARTTDQLHARHAAARRLANEAKGVVRELREALAAARRARCLILAWDAVARARARLRQHLVPSDEPLRWLEEELAALEADLQREAANPQAQD
jgi:hypothetical protein